MNAPAAPVAVRTVSAGRGSDWIAEGYELFRQKPGTWIGLILLWALLGAILNTPGIALIGSFLNPVFVAGLMLGCASQARGEGIRVGHLFAGFRSGHLGQLLMLTVWMILLTILLAAAGFLIVCLPLMDKFQGFDLDTTSAADAVVTVASSLDLLTILLVALVVLALSLMLAMAVWFAPALIVMRGASAFEAMKLSVRACTRNMLPFLVYGLLALVVLLVGALSLLLGLLVAFPVLTASVYTSYRDIFPEQAAPG